MCIMRIRTKDEDSVLCLTDRRTPGLLSFTTVVSQEEAGEPEHKSLSSALRY
jgi:hypothetical protein